MTDNSIIVALTVIMGSAVAATIYGARYRKRHRAEKRRRRGYKEYNRGRPKLLTGPATPPSARAESRARS